MIQTIQQLYPSLTGVGIILFCIFFLFYLIRFVYLFLFTGRILFKKERITDNNNTGSPISLLLTIRNEEELLKRNLPALLNIDGIDYEVIAVDDFSQDNTYLILGSYKKQSSKLKMSSLNEETRYSYKLSQNIALKSANHDWVLPISIAMENPNASWLLSFTKSIAENKDIIIGYETIEKDSGITNHLYRICNFGLFLKSTAYVLNGLPIIYSDENVAFKKQKYFAIGGYGTKIKEPFANLELLINDFIRKKRTVILFNSESTMRKKQKASWNDLFNLLKKSYRIEQHLSLKKQFFLKVDEYSQLIYLVLSVLLIALFYELWIIYLILFGIQSIAYLLIIKISLKRLREPKIFISSLVYGILNPFFNLPYRWYFNYRSRKNKWRSMT